MSTQTYSTPRKLVGIGILLALGAIIALSINTAITGTKYEEKGIVLILLPLVYFTLTAVLFPISIAVITPLIYAIQFLNKKLLNPQAFMFEINDFKHIVKNLSGKFLEILSAFYKSAPFWICIGWVATGTLLLIL